MKDYIVTMPYCWGRAKTISKARQIAKRNRPSFANINAELIYEILAGEEYIINENGTVTGKGARQIGRKG